jgi:Zn-dependent protease
MSRRAGSVKLMQVAGIRVGADVSWFVALFLVIYWLSGFFRETLRSSDSTAYLTAVISALLLFASLIFHELGHALAARRHGIEVKRIDLFLFGGLAQMSRDSRTAGEELQIAAAGPLATLIVVIAALAVDLAVVGPSHFVHAATLSNSEKITPVKLTLSWLATMNVVILVFNLIPAFPLDGGRIARAVVWRITGDRTRGTRAAALLGQGFSYILIGIGIYDVLLVGDFGGLWFVLLGMFVGQAARGAVIASRFTESIEGVRVADIMDSQPVAVPAETPIARALDEWFLRYRWQWFPVVDGGGRFTGIVREERVQHAIDTGQGHLLVSAVTDEETAADWRIGADQPLESLLGSEPLRRFGALMAVDGDGVLRGVVTVDQVRRAVQSAVAPQA